MKQAAAHILMLFIVSLITLCSVFAQTPVSIKGRVLDEENQPLVGIRVSVQDGDFLQTDQQGNFTLLADRPLAMPVFVDLATDKYEIVEVAYYEEESKLLVKTQRILNPDDVIKVLVLDTAGNYMPMQELVVHDKPYKTNNKGIVRLKEPVQANVEVIIPGFTIKDKKFLASQHSLSVIASAVPKLVKDTLLISVGADFDRLLDAIIEEREVFEKKNEEIRAEVLKIHNKLINENDLSDKQRGELTKYLMNVEKVLQENAEALRKSEERTKEAINRLKAIIIEKDSLNLIAQGKIEKMAAERDAAEMAYRKKVMLFVGAIAFLLSIIVVVYIFAAKYKNQRTWLEEVNIRLKATQQELTRSLNELNLRKAQIEDHNDQLELFVYKASHDIKGPLRSIMGLTQIGIQDVSDPGAKEYFEHIHKSTKRLDNLLVDLLKLTKAKQAEIERVEVDLPSMVDEIIQSFNNVNHFKLITFNVNIEEGLRFITDEKMIHSVIQNFVENAIKYCDPYKPEPYFNLSVFREGRKVVFKFEDNGLGIDEQHASKIFDMFYKIDPASDGTGLGLHIVKITIEKLNGKIEVSSRRREGSTFTITFDE